MPSSDELSAFRLPGAVLLGMLLLFPRPDRIPAASAVAAGVFAACLAAGLEPQSAALMTIAGCGGPLLACTLIDRFAAGPVALTSRRGLAVLFLGLILAAVPAGLTGALAATTAGAASLTFVWSSWALGDIVGGLLVVPVMLGVAELVREPGWRAGLAMRRALEGAAAIVVLTLSAVLLFLINDGSLFADLPFLCLPLIVWCALMLPPGVAAGGVLAIALVAMTATDAGRGPFSEDSASASQEQLELQLYAFVLATIGLVGSALTGDHKRAQTNVQRERNFAAALLESVGEGVVAMDETGRLTIFNREARRIHGLPGESSVEEIENHRERTSSRFESVDSAGDGHYLSPREIPIMRALRGESVRDREMRITPPNGPPRDVRVSAAPITDSAGNSLGAVVALSDETQYRRVEQARGEAEERFRRAFEDSGSAMALISTESGDEGRFEDVNEAMCRLSGRPAGELCETSLWGLLHEDDLPIVRAGMRDLESGRLQTYTGEHRMLAADETTRWTSLGISLVRGARGEPTQAVVQAQDVTERKRFEGRLQHMADHDPLTGLFNRRRFEEELGREATRAARSETGGAVLVLDLDNFKLINDSLGHQVGDELLRRTANELSSRLRKTDIVARLGGDEFGVILPDTTTEQAREVAASLCDVVRRNATVESEGNLRRATASIGISLFHDRSKLVTAEDLVVEADVAMYDAKEQGRDGYTIYDASSADGEDRMRAKLDWVERIRVALEQQRFVLHAQPIMALGDADPRPRHELLIRMISPTGELIPPASFLRVAERFELIRQIDRWVVRKGIELLAAEQARGHDVVFEINLSARSLDDAELPAAIESMITASGADPRGLVFEITETEAIVNVGAARAFADSLMALGCGFALDDFGAGFASFYYLKHLSFDYLKIDGEFVRELASSPTDQMVVRAVVEIAQRLGKHTIAEFVGDAETLELVRELGVDYAQGYHVGKPRPVEAAGLFPADGASMLALERSRDEDDGSAGTRGRRAGAAVNGGSANGKAAGRSPASS